jgi:hypothetical protein
MPKDCILRIQSAFKRKASTGWPLVFLIRYLTILMDLKFCSDVHFAAYLNTSEVNVIAHSITQSCLSVPIYCIGTFTNLKGRIPYKQEYNGKWTMEVSRGV